MMQRWPPTNRYMLYLYSVLQCFFGKTKKRLFPIETKLSIRRSYPASEKSKQIKPKHGALRWHGHSGANCLVHTYE